MHKISEPILAIPCWGVFANYDSEAPDTKIFFLLATEKLAQEIAHLLNKNPRKWNRLAYVGGCEGYKTFKITKTFCATDKAGEIFTSLEDLKSSDPFEDGDFDEDGDDEERES